MKKENTKRKKRTKTFVLTTSASSAKATISAKMT